MTEPDAVESIDSFIETHEPMILALREHGLDRGQAVLACIMTQVMISIDQMVESVETLIARPDEDCDWHT